MDGWPGAREVPAEDLASLDAFEAYGFAACVPNETVARLVLCISSNRPGRKTGDQTPQWLDMAAADLSLLNSGHAPLLLDHFQSFDNLIGVIERAWVGPSECFAVARLGTTVRCREALTMVQAGILTNVSLTARAVFEDEPDGTGARRARYWCPYEVSLVTVPRDWSTFVAAGPMPERMKDAARRSLAARASGSPASWRAWAADVSRQLAPEAAEQLRDAMEAELGRLYAEATAWLAYP